MPYDPPRLHEDQQLCRVLITPNPDEEIAFAAVIGSWGANTRPETEIFQEFVNTLGAHYTNMTCDFETFTVMRCTPDA